MHTLTQFFVSSDTLQLRAIKLSVWHGLLGVVSQSCAGCFPWFVSRRCKGPLLSFLTQTHGISWAEHMMHVDISADPGTAGENTKTGLNLAELPTEATTATATAAATTTTTATTATTTTTTTTTTTATTTTRTRYKQQGTNNHWDPVLTIYLFLFLPLRVQTNTGTPSLLFSPPQTTTTTHTFHFSAAGPLFVPWAGWILQKGGRRHISSDLHLFQVLGLDPSKRSPAPHQLRPSPFSRCWTPFPAVSGRDPPKRGAATWPQSSFHFDFFTGLTGHRGCTCVSSLCSWLSACGRCFLCVRSCLDIPVFFQKLQSIPCMPGTSSSVGRVQGP